MDLSADLTALPCLRPKQASQAADKWHLPANIRQAVKRWIAR